MNKKNISLTKFLASKSHGFTLIEIIVVMSILGIVAGLTMIVSLDNYRSYSFGNERTLAISILDKARNQAINNICLGESICTDGKPHGVHFGTGLYVIFQGASYQSRDASFDEVIQSQSPNTKMSGLTDVVFAQLSGNAIPTPTGSWDVILSDNAGHISTTTLNSEGRVTWTH